MSFLAIVSNSSNYLRRSFKLTARASGIILLGDSLGRMALPRLAGLVIRAAGPRAMVYLVLVSLLLNLLAFVGMARLRPAWLVQSGVT